MKRNGFSLVELLVVVAIIGIVAGLLLPAVQSVRESARKTSCKNQVRQIAIGIEQYHSQHNRFPHGWNNENGDNSPGWGWMSYTLPFLELDDLAEQIEHDVDLRDDQFAELIQTHLPVLHCPSSPEKNIETFTLERRDGMFILEERVFPIEMARAQYVGCLGTITSKYVQK